MAHMEKHITIRPIISYPKVAEPGKIYLMTVNLQIDQKDYHWPYDEEEYAIYCIVETDLFSHEAIGEPVIVLNRFGGSYGAASFKLIPTLKKTEGLIRLKLINDNGILLDIIPLYNIKIRRKYKEIENSKRDILHQNLFSIVRISLGKSNNGLLGMGFLISKAIVVTCDHVVNSFSGSTDMDFHQVYVDFPFLLEIPILEAKVIERFPNEDIAFLELITDETLLPDNATLSSIFNYEPSIILDRPVTIFGFSNRFTDGFFINGNLIGKPVNGLYEIDLRLEDYGNLSGLSGAPVWDEYENIVCGILSAKSDKNTYSMIPISSIIKYHLKIIGGLQINSEMDLAAEIDNYKRKIASLHACLPMAGFATQIAVPIQLMDIHVPLSAVMDLGGLNDKRFTCSEQAAKYLEDRDCGMEIPLVETVRQAVDRRFRGSIILGDPGSGKTTHLKRLLLECLDPGPEKLGLPKDMLPVFLPLRELEDLEKGLDAFIQKQMESPHLNVASDFGKQLLKRGNLLFLLDGLDEVTFLARREQVARWITKALLLHKDCHFIVTCRFAGYSPGVKLESGLLELHILPFTAQQAEAFIANWYNIVERLLAKDLTQVEAIAREKAESLIKIIRSRDFRSSRVAELTRNPLLLTNICLVHRFRGVLPEKRSRLYEDCINTLLEGWRAAKGINVEFSVDKARQALQPVALWLHEEEGRTQATAGALSPHIEPVLKALEWQKGDAVNFLRTIRDESGLLTGWDQEHYGFMHLGFQEYLAAREIRSRYFKNPSVLTALVERFGQSWWQEVTLLLLTLEDPYLFVPFMREVVKHEAFVNHKNLVEACLNDASERSAQPFLELLAKPPGKDKGLWDRQLYALILAERLAPDKVKGMHFKLANHPFDLIRNRITGKTAQEARQPVKARRGGYELVKIPAGKFVIGSDLGEEGHYRNEGPMRKVKVPSFYMGRYPVTNKEYRIFLQENPDEAEPRFWTDRRFNQPRQPVVGVSWEEARRYATWAGLSLPSEVEWEYACRAGTDTRYYTGDSESALDRAGWYRKNSGGQTHPVGEKEPNAWGLYDMHGNVWEWLEDDWHSNYKSVPGDSMAWKNIPRDAYRVLRGGAWGLVAEYCRSAARYGFTPGDRNDNIGFRLVLRPGQQVGR